MKQTSAHSGLQIRPIEVGDNAEVADKDTCELRKMYFRAELRGLGVGTQLLELCLERASKAGFRYCYLETIDSMQQAQTLYGKYGFKYLDKPIGNTGHSSCGTWMARDL